MSSDPSQSSIDFHPAHEFFIGIDSDGCAFDTMEIKHKECFIPTTIRHFQLQAVAKHARECAEFVNLYSKWRGINRFPALALTLDLLVEHPEAQKRDVAIPRLRALHHWLERERKPGNPALETMIRAVDGSEAAELRRVLEWSKAVNRAVREMVQGIQPFPGVRECLDAASKRADVMVVSATPTEALEREWKEHHLAGYVSLIAGQEMGTKAEHLRLAARGRYKPYNVLMIGDAPGDLEAARANETLFYPINPGAEASSWERLLGEALDRFFAGTYRGDYAAALIAEFEALLPDTPPWKRA
jgi:phosphoglycolate phosphatase-like HAD superfamily hydrolase